MRKRPINCCFCSFRLAAYCSLAPTQQFLQLIEITKWAGFIIYLTTKTSDGKGKLFTMKLYLFDEFLVVLDV